MVFPVPVPSSDSRRGPNVLRQLEMEKRSYKSRIGLDPKNDLG
jgi:hypothetical protein